MPKHGAKGRVPIWWPSTAQKNKCSLTIYKSSFPKIIGSDSQIRYDQFLQTITLFSSSFSSIFQTKMLIIAIATTLDTSILCDHWNGWQTFEDRCYYFRKSNKNWAGAEKWCVGVGGNLVSVNSQKVQTFLNDQQVIYNEPYWIGFADKVGSGL